MRIVDELKWRESLIPPGISSNKELFTVRSNYGVRKTKRDERLNNKIRNGSNLGLGDQRQSKNN
jgi:hypothetical protein